MTVRILRFLGWYCVLSAVLALGMLVAAFPSHPRTLAGWLAFFALALPVTLLGEAIGAGVWRNPLARRIDEQTAGKSLSGWRMAYAFAAMLLVFAAAWKLAAWSGL